MYIGWSDITVISGHNMFSVLWGNMAYCVKFSDEPLSCYLNKIESVGVRKCPVITVLLRKCCHNNKHSTDLAPHGGKTAGIDMV